MTSETEYLALFHSISQRTHPLSRPAYQAINPRSGSRICTQFGAKQAQGRLVEKPTVCGLGSALLWRCDITRKTFIHTLTTAKIHMQPPSRASLCSGNRTEQTVTSRRARSRPGVTDEHRQRRVSCPGCSQVLQELRLRWPQSRSPPGADAHSR